MEMKEEWRPVARFPGCVLSNRGRFKKENGKIISPQVRKRYITYGWRVHKIRRGTTVNAIMKDTWPEVPRAQFYTSEWAKAIREENELAKPKRLQEPQKEPETVIEWDNLDYFPGCINQYDPQYCPLG